MQSVNHPVHRYAAILLLLLSIEAGGSESVASAQGELTDHQIFCRTSCLVRLECKQIEKPRLMDCISRCESETASDSTDIDKSNGDWLIAGMNAHLKKTDDSRFQASCEAFAHARTAQDYRMITLVARAGENVSKLTAACEQLYDREMRCNTQASIAQARSAYVDECKKRYFGQIKDSEDDEVAIGHLSARMKQKAGSPCDAAAAPDRGPSATAPPADAASAVAAAQAAPIRPEPTPTKPDLSVVASALTAEQKEANKLIDQALAAAASASDVDSLARAIDAFAKPGRGDRDKARKMNDEGLALLRSHQIDDAVKALRAAASTDPGDVEIADNLAYALARAGRLQEANIQVRRALTLAPRRSAAWGNLAGILARLGSSKESVAAFKIAFQFSRNQNATLDYLRRLNESAEEAEVREAAGAALKMVGG